MRDKMAEKIPHFFYHNVDPGYSQKLSKKPLIITDSKLQDLLNAQLDRENKYALLMLFIQSHDAEYLSQQITIHSHTTIEKVGHTPPHWTTLATKRIYGYPDPKIQETPSITTLANIIATNELNFTSTQMATLFRELMAKRVNFVTLDQTPYLNLIHPKSGNNPLKSLIVSSLDDPNLIELLYDFIGYIENSITHEEQLFIINNEDNFEYESMLPAEFLIRLGHEDLALRLYNLGAKPTPFAFRLACASFGTTIHYEAAMQCIQLLMDSLDLEEPDLREGKVSLKKASPTQYNEMLPRIVQMLREDSKLDRGYSSLFETIQNEYLEHYQDKTSLSFRDFCQHKANIDHPLIQKYALLRIKQENVGNGFFSVYYRTEPHLAEKKWALLQRKQEANQLLLDLITLVDNADPKCFLAKR
ncbi:hypothetical protein Lgra_0486 [Legionella gratiana]|uniref:Uncharacterized protein n=1 Tax=Legionella gratiana TaxID=45066 RepID=A0A378JHN5_9GAMM|nr:hypothetical protein [Legionella gratiana]KTD14783.1 hypothetical protein Lgra_0486 [Legionella gratiana]STX44190.1 Uncharacterised protein [Legionella gratiana]